MSSEGEEYLIERVTQLERLLLDRQDKLISARESVAFLERVVHRAALIAGHLPAMCSSLPEVSTEMEQAAMQLQQILVHREI